MHRSEGRQAASRFGGVRRRRPAEVDGPGSRLEPLAGGTVSRQPAYQRMNAVIDFDKSSEIVV